jgi:hypothetical protein
MGLPLPPLYVDGALDPYVVIAAPMVVLTVVVLGLARPSDRRPPLVTQMLLALAVLSGSSVLLVSLVFVILNPSSASAWIWAMMAFNFMMMVPLGLWFIGHIVFEDRRVRQGRWAWPASFGVAVTGSEVLMGLVFAVGGASGAIGAATAFSLGLSSVWFYWSMAVVMGPLVLWAPLSPVGRTGGWALVVAALLGPWVPTYPVIGGAAMAALMIGATVALLRPLSRGEVPGSEGRLLLGLAGVFLAMTSAGLGVAITAGAPGAVLAFGITMALVMVAEVSYLVKRTYLPGAGREVPVALPGTVAPAEVPASHAALTGGP